MQRPDENKRREILQAATRLFATRAYHEVRLEDVAVAAHVGKGTLYIYFESKDDLYLTLVREGFAQLVSEARAHSDRPGAGAWERVEGIVASLVGFAFRFPNLFRVMRSGAITPEDPELQRLRRELTGLIESAIRAGNRRGECRDPCPALTAQFVLSFVRGALLYPPPGLNADGLKRHILLVLRDGLSPGARRAPARRGRAPGARRAAKA